MKQILKLNHKVNFNEGASFSQRESLINSEILKIQNTIKGRGFYPIQHNVVNKNSKNATIEITYQT